MKKVIGVLPALLAALSVLAASDVRAKTVGGRITSVSSSSISMFDKELITVQFDSRTAFTRLVTQKSWQQSTAFTADALRVGRYVVAHLPETNGGIATWVQIATDGPLNAVVEPASPLPSFATARYTLEAERHLAEAVAARATSGASESKRPGSVDTAAYHERLAAEGRTIEEPVPPAAGPVNHEAELHRAEARARRASPTASETKRPGAPDTALHCERIADQLQSANR